MATVTSASGSVAVSATTVEIALPVSAWRGARIRRITTLVAGRTLLADVPEAAADALRRGDPWIQALDAPGATLRLDPRGLTVTLPLGLLGTDPGAATLVLSPVPLPAESLAALASLPAPAEVPAPEPCTIVVMRAALDVAVPRLRVPPR